MSELQKLDLPYRTLTEPSLTIITPTLGRPSIGMTLDSGFPLGANDEWLVVGDGPQSYAEWRVGQRNVTYPKFDIRYMHTESTGICGNYQRDVAMEAAKGDYLVFVDDDDVFAPNALNVIKQTIGGNSEPCPWFFRMITPTGQLLWKEQIVDRGTVGGSMFVVPNDPARLARWSDNDGHDSDFLFIQETLRLWQPTPPKWAGEVIVVCKPDYMGLRMEIKDWEQFNV